MIQKAVHRMQLFDPQIAERFGLHLAIVYQELIQAKAQHSPEDAAHGVMAEKGIRWDRYGRDELCGMFPYFSAEQIVTILRDLEKIGLIRCRFGQATDYVWVTLED